MAFLEKENLFELIPTQFMINVMYILVVSFSQKAKELDERVR